MATIHNTDPGGAPSIDEQFGDLIFQDNREEDKESLNNLFRKYRAQRRRSGFPYSKEFQNARFSDKISETPLRTNIYTHFKIYRQEDFEALLGKVNEVELILLFKIVELLMKVLKPELQNNFSNQISMRNLSPRHYAYVKFFVSRVVTALYNPDIPFPNIDLVETIYSSEMSLLRRYIKVNNLEEPSYEEVLLPFFRFFVASEA